MKFFAISDVGSVRERNEDCCLAKEYADGALFAVFDGMGGANAGEVASATARDEVETYFDAFLRKRKWTNRLRSRPRSPPRRTAPTRKSLPWRRTIRRARAWALRLWPRSACAKKIYIANVGDSRAYLIDREVAMQLTRDHSFVQYLVDLGKITPEEARTNPKKNIITRAVGVEKRGQRRRVGAGKKRNTRGKRSFFVLRRTLRVYRPGRYGKNPCRYGRLRVVCAVARGRCKQSGRQRQHNRRGGQPVKIPEEL